MRSFISFYTIHYCTLVAVSASLTGKKGLKRQVKSIVFYFCYAHFLFRFVVAFLYIIFLGMGDSFALKAPEISHAFL
jgi:hypothetical protein